MSGVQRHGLTALLVSDAATLLAAAMTVTAMPFVVLSAGAGASALALVSAALLVAELVALLVGGVLADRWPRERMMAAADIVQAVSVAALALAFTQGSPSVGLLVAAAAVRGVGLGLFLPASQALLPQIVAEELLARANSVRRVVANIAQVAGALLGGVLTAWAGAAAALGVMAALFWLGAAARAGLRGLPRSTAPVQSLLRTATSGFREFTSRRWLWSVVSGFAVINAVFVGVTTVLGPLIVIEHFQGASSWGAVAAACAAGAIAGAGAAIARRPRHPLMLAVMFTALVALEPLALALGPLPTVLAAAFAAGFGIEVFGVHWVTTLQAHVPLAAMSRVSAFDAVGSFAISPIGPVVAAALAAAIGPSHALIASAAVILSMCVALIAIPEVRRLGPVQRIIDATSPQGRTVAGQS